MCFKELLLEIWQCNGVHVKELSSLCGADIRGALFFLEINNFCFSPVNPSLSFLLIESQPKWDCSLQLPCWCWLLSHTQVQLLLVLTITSLLWFPSPTLLLPRCLTSLLSVHDPQRLRTTPSRRSSLTLASSCLRCPWALQRRPRPPLRKFTRVNLQPKPGKRWHPQKISAFTQIFTRTLCVTRFFFTLYSGAGSTSW